MLIKDKYRGKLPPRLLIMVLILTSYDLQPCTSSKGCNKNDNEHCRFNVEGLMKDVAILQMKNRIKQQILIKLGLPVRPTPPMPTEIPSSVLSKGRKERTLSTQQEENFTVSSTAIKPNINELLIVSELPDNITDKNIIKFQPQLVFLNQSQSNQTQKMLVKSANLLIRVKRKRGSKSLRVSSRDDQKVLKTSRRRKLKAFSITVSTVDEFGKPDRKVATVKSKIRRSKWFNVSLPSSLIQNMIDKSQTSLLLHIKCRRCRKHAEVILVHGTRKRRRHMKQTHKGGSRRQRSRRARTRRSKINKSRPILVVLTFMESVSRSKRSSRDINQGQGRIRNRKGDNQRHTQRQHRAPLCSQLRSRSGCCRQVFYFDFKEVGWEDWIVAPSGFITAECLGSCSNSASNSTNEIIVRSSQTTCQSFQPIPLGILYISDSGTVLYRLLSDMLVTDCACQSLS